MRRWGLLAAAVAIAVAAGGVTYATATAGGTIHACIEPSGKLRFVDIASSCRKNELALEWDQQGPAGPPGATGADGPPGPAGGGAHAYQTANFGSVSVTVTFPALTTIVAMTLPAGSYQLTAQGTFLLNTVFEGVGGVSGVFHNGSALCLLHPQKVDGIPVQSPSTFNAAGVTAVGEGRTTSLTELVTLVAPTQVSFGCALNAGQVNVVGARLFAVQVADITTLENEN